MPQTKVTQNAVHAVHSLLDTKLAEILQPILDAETKPFQAEIESLKVEINAVNDKSVQSARESSDKISALNNEKVGLKHQVDLLTDDVTQLNAQLSEAQAQTKSASEENGALRKQLNDANAKVQEPSKDGSAKSDKT